MNDIGCVIWGIGARGKLLLNLCHPFVKAVIDKNLVELQYENIPVISIETYIDRYQNYPIIITPKGYEDEIECELLSHKIEKYYKYTDVGNCIRHASKISSSDWLIPENNSKKVYLCGHIIAVWHTFLLLQRKNIDCEIVQEDELSMDAFYDNINKNSMVYLLNCSLESKIKKKLLQLKIPFVDISDFYRYPELYQHENMRVYNNIHKDDSCFIVATGPSLRKEDLYELSKHNIVTFSCNRMILQMESLEWEPNYYVLSDITATRYAFENVKKHQEIKAFISDSAWFDKLDACKNVEQYHLDFFDDANATCFSDNGEFMYAGKTVTYVMLQLAVYMGFKKIYLLGVDCNYVRGGQNNYFGSKTEADYIDHETEKMLQAYKSAKQYADSHGIKIYNATRGGMLEVFERVDFDSLFK